MNQKKNFKWGIIGCGKIAHKFAEDLMTIPNAILYAVASRDLKKAKDFGKAYNTYSCYGSYKELVTNPEIDIIYIATPHVFHFENSLMCLTHKKAVLCEKPFAMNTKQVKEMITVAKNNDTFLMEALWTYFLPHYKYVLNIIQSNELGKVKNLKVDFGFASTYDTENRLFNKKLGGGSLLDVGIYPLFAALSILGYPEEIEANATFNEDEIDENCSMLLTYKNNTLASLYSSITEKTNTEAIIELENGTITINSRFHEPSSVTITRDGIQKLHEFTANTNGYSFEAIHVQEMLEQGNKESTIMTFDKSLQLIRLLDTVRDKINLYYD
ncbi:gfo/Idh/MocA family oxidoreductase [Aquimarina sp. BL5]|uniref:Gfo/Idh/MocA family protein n=1 Tax=Aquimarina sp. BL5 TaxID=1714860 RepID=UPI000E48B89A|nr:Gfo/Idh/MocA family oxidoreductase [Aquimarina sp. BL5]AXT49375.1 gfo/Idh/MocA family oxidoreductase [Aquimarina sp. BL5]RKN07952.1 gfo/Idh/MocA family oxidoreductase [Aquimarina sp. BL5]